MTDMYLTGDVRMDGETIVLNCVKTVEFEERLAQTYFLIVDYQLI